MSLNDSNVWDVWPKCLDCCTCVFLKEREENTVFERTLTTVFCGLEENEWAA